MSRRGILSVVILVLVSALSWGGYTRIKLYQAERAAVSLLTMVRHDGEPLLLVGYYGADGERSVLQAFREPGGEPLWETYTGRLWNGASSSQREVFCVEDTLILYSSFPPRMTAHDLRTGERKWNRDWPEAVSLASEPSILGEHLLLPMKLAIVSEFISVEAISLESGRSVWTQRIDEPVLAGSVPLSDAMLFFQQSVWRVDAAGAQRIIPNFFGRLIPDPPGALFVDLSEHLQRIDQSGSVQPVLTPEGVVSLEHSSFYDVIGRYGDDLLFSQREGRQLVRFPLDGQAGWTVSFPYGSVLKTTFMSPLRALQYAETRYHPFLLAAEDDEHAVRVVVVDLDRGELVWSSTALLDSPLQDSWEDVWYDEQHFLITLELEGSLLAILDGKTGQLERAVQLLDEEGRPISLWLGTDALAEGYVVFSTGGQPVVLTFPALSPVVLPEGLEVVDGMPALTALLGSLPSPLR